MHAKYLLALSLVASASLARADDVVTVGQLSQVQSEALLLQAKVKKSEAQRRLAELGAAGNAPTLTIGSPTTDSQPSGTPSVSGAAGAYGKLVATFVYPDGSTYEAGPGRDIPGGYTVSRVTTSEVVLMKAGKPIRLALGQIAPREQKPVSTSATSFPQLPGSMPALAQPIR
ncbi:type IV pilus biogenesis protein PilP [Pseudomonas sp. PDM20]|uniref:type IV pilus biogenesis protein PilP n=1 Tax=Pseudomonas sp. PDM20 TaxID=2769254 RepID=UPI0017849393|nr:type IV pilus biogenesis protein PilP [Pseudomonas sp. PDM20]MBD9686846.1 type IV pilus biogenesis protein PilP [Pseudomonas sp. PDM20]